MSDTEKTGFLDQVRAALVQKTMATPPEVELGNKILDAAEKAIKASAPLVKQGVSKMMQQALTTPTASDFTAALILGPENVSQKCEAETPSAPLKTPLCNAAAVLKGQGK